MTKGIRVWVISGIAYLILVIAGYSAITGANPLTSGEMHHVDHDNNNAHEEEHYDNDHNDHENNESHNDYEENHNDGEHNEHNDNEEHDHGDTHAHGGGDSEVTVHVTYESGKIQVHLEDDEGHAPELRETHEELMHLIVVSDELEDYFHYHPVQLEKDLFETEVSLEEGTYYVFVDISPQGKDYSIEPMKIDVGEGSSDRPQLTSDSVMKQVQEGKEVVFSHTELSVGDPVTLTFELSEAPQPYLGALGHVVIIDEDVEEFIHVHPMSKNETVFDAHFEKPGTYKLWAEFKFEGQGVLVFSYVFEIE
ncbi:hypothetical protein [Evansella halocellulosilytica]|uniref:hypothetical protein n=1 Tax=Evansella halocellulosilytica TaxID=2011013 RepID=UPI000BB78A5E|nr:hypothetical protein [Evansella halocellulosilytica]